MFTRRNFIKAIGSFGFAILTPINQLLTKWNTTSNQVEELEGELYQGFVLLEKDASIPSFVQGAPSPILGEVKTADENNPQVFNYRGITKWFSQAEEVRKDINFPLFLPAQLPEKMAVLQGYVIRFSGSGQIWEARIDFGLVDNQEPVISLSARPVFYRPYPVWPILSYPTKELGETIRDDEFFVVKPEKVTYTPQPGIKLPTAKGFMLQWIKSSILYTLYMEYEGWSGIAELVGNSLIEK